MFDWHNKGFIYKQLSHKDFNATVIHSVVTYYLERLEKCLQTYNEVVCFYDAEGKDGDLDVSFSKWIDFCDFRFIDDILIRAFFWLSSGYL